MEELLKVGEGENSKYEEFQREAVRSKKWEVWGMDQKWREKRGAFLYSILIKLIQQTPPFWENKEKRKEGKKKTNVKEKESFLRKIEGKWSEHTNETKSDATRHFPPIHSILFSIHYSFSSLTLLSSICPNLAFILIQPHLPLHGRKFFFIFKIYK